MLRRLGAHCGAVRVYLTQTPAQHKEAKRANAVNVFNEADFAMTKWTPIYQCVHARTVGWNEHPCRFTPIALLTKISQFKVAQTVFMVLLTGHAYTGLAEGAITDAAFVGTCGLAAFATIMLFVFSFYVQRLIGGGALKCLPR